MARGCLVFTVVEVGKCVARGIAFGFGIAFNGLIAFAI